MKWPENVSCPTVITSTVDCCTSTADPRRLHWLVAIGDSGIYFLLSILHFMAAKRTQDNKHK